MTTLPPAPDEAPTHPPAPSVSIRVHPWPFNKLLSLLRGRDKGTVTVTFLLTLPLFLLIMSLITQYAMIINAQLVVDHAAATAARSAMTALPTDPSIDMMADNQPFDGAAIVKEAACVQLEPVSPVAKTGITDTARLLMENLQTAGIPVGNSFASRYTFADAATEVHWQPIDDNGNPVGDPDPPPAVISKYRSQRMKVTVRYKFYLNAPGARILLGHLETVAGITARYITLTASYDVQLSHGRETLSDPEGNPEAMPAGWDVSQ